MPKGPPPAEGKQAWDWHSRAGRERLDAAVLRTIVEHGGRLPRGAVDRRLGVGGGENGLKVVGASLKRNEAAGLLRRIGSGTLTEYEATAEGKSAAEKGGGR